MTHIPNIEDCPRTTWAADPNSKADIRIVASHSGGYVVAYRYPHMSGWEVYGVNTDGIHSVGDPDDELAIIIPAEVANA